MHKNQCDLCGDSSIRVKAGQCPELFDRSFIAYLERDDINAIIKTTMFPLSLIFSTCPGTDVQQVLMFQFSAKLLSGADRRALSESDLFI